MQRYFAIDKKDKYFKLEEKDYHHIKTVMRMKENDVIEVVFNKTLYLAHIENIKEDIIIIEDKLIEIEKDNSKKVNIIIPYLKEQKLDFIFQKATELGVDKITLVPFSRSVVKLKEKSTKYTRWNRILKEASEQSKRLVTPNLNLLESFKEIKNLDGLNLICSTAEKNQTIKKVMKTSTNYDTINIVIGPEGGLTEQEENTLVEYGYKKVTFGNRILRVETVPLYILSIINYEFME